MSEQSSGILGRELDASEVDTGTDGIVPASSSEVDVDAVDMMEPANPIESDNEIANEPIFDMGDVVQLKSGGMWMTVLGTRIDESSDDWSTDEVECMYEFREGGGMMSLGSSPYLRSVKLPAAMLVLVPSDQVAKRRGWM